MSTKEHPDRPMSRADMVAIFQKMGEICRDHNSCFEIAIYGGSAIMLSFDYRESTMDIDFIPVCGSADKISSIANQAAQALGFPAHLLRDDVSVFISDLAKYQPYGEFPKGAGNLRVFTAAPQYILAMKILSMRSAMENQDFRDIWELSDACDIKDAATAIELVKQFYPGKVLPTRNRLLLEDVFESKQKKECYSPMIGR